MLAESLEALAVRNDGIYLDGSFGGGGHTAGMLSRFNKSARVFAIDRDPYAIANAQIKDKRLILQQCPWSDLTKFGAQHELFGRVDGVLLDLGVSSFQLNEGARGFSFNLDGPLDMRMDPHHGMPASTWINSASAEQLSKVFREYGEEPCAWNVAKAIVRERIKSRIESTAELARIVAANTPPPKRRHPATRVFQAVRMHINRELEELDAALRVILDLLCVGGRMVVISFHSLEDRMVKRFIRRHSNKSAMVKPNIPLRQDELPTPCLRITANMRQASEQEIQINPSARSACMRVAERIAC